MFLTDLNEDELILIFGLCSEVDHKNLSRVCRQFDDIIEKNFVERKCRNLLMVSHVKSFPDLFKRTLNENMKYSERLRIHQNWMFGSCQQVEFFQHRENYVTHLQMDEQFLYAASLGEFNVYRRQIDEGIDVKPTFSAGRKNDSIISSLKIKGENVTGSRLNGSIFTYNDNDGYSMDFLRGHAINDLDFHKDVFVTATQHGMKFHRLESELGMPTFDTTEESLDLDLRTVNFNPTGEKILGTSVDNFYLIDSLTKKSQRKNLKSTEIFKTQWISESSFMFTSWNSPLSLVDCRSEFIKQDFSCGNFTATSIVYDGRFGVIYGTLLGMLILCDLRNPRMFERVFHLDRPAVCRSLASDESHLYVATDNAIHLLNFN